MRVMMDTFQIPDSSRVGVANILHKGPALDFWSEYLQVHDQPIAFEEFCLALSGRFEYVAKYGRWQQNI